VTLLFGFKTVVINSLEKLLKGVSQIKSILERMEISMDANTSRIVADIQTLKSNVADVSTKLADLTQFLRDNSEDAAAIAQAADDLEGLNTQLKAANDAAPDPLVPPVEPPVTPA
jgi:hypothetical protein